MSKLVELDAEELTERLVGSLADQRGYAVRVVGGSMSFTKGDETLALRNSPAATRFKQQSAAKAAVSASASAPAPMPAPPTTQAEKAASHVASPVERAAPERFVKICELDKIALLAKMQSTSMCNDPAFNGVLVGYKSFADDQGNAYALRGSRAARELHAELLARQKTEKEHANRARVASLDERRRSSILDNAKRSSVDNEPKGAA